VQHVFAGPLARALLLIVARRRHVVDVNHKVRQGGLQVLSNVLDRPDVKRPLFHVPFRVQAISVLGGEEPAVRGLKVAADVRKHLAGRALVPVGAGRLVRLRVRQDMHGLVVQHLLEVGKLPLLIGGVPVEAVSHLIEEAAPPHPVERRGNLVEGRLLARTVPVAQQKEQVVRRRKLRGRPEPPVRPIELLGELPRRVVEERRPGRVPVRLVVPDALEPVGDLLGVVEKLRPVVAVPELPDPRQQVHEARLLKPPFFRQVRRREKGLPVRGKEHGQRPPALPPHHLADVHVDAVDVGALLAVHLDRHEAVVEERGHVVVLEGLPLHDVAPVARRVPNGQEDGLVLLARFRERRVAPRAPVDGVVLVLAQVRALLVGEAVGHGVVSVLVNLSTRTRSLGPTGFGRSGRRSGRGRWCRTRRRGNWDCP